MNIVRMMAARELATFFRRSENLTIVGDDPFELYSDESAAD